MAIERMGKASTNTEPIKRLNYFTGACQASPLPLFREILGADDKLRLFIGSKPERRKRKQGPYEIISF